jgi:hypothetical protein
MRKQKSQKSYQLTLEFPNHMTRVVRVKAASREVAERRALKRNPGAVAVRH